MRATVTITCHYTRQSWTHELPSRGEARKLALRMAAAGYYVTYGGGR